MLADAPRVRIERSMDSVPGHACLAVTITC